MKNIFKSLIILGVVLLGSCSDLLDTEPRQSLTPQVVFADIEGYESFLFSIYNRAISFNYYGQQMMIAPEIMADNLRIIANTGRYIGQEANADRAHINLWNFSTVNNFRGMYAGINDANILLASIDDVDADVGRRNRVKGEASFFRAMFYFDFARIYGYEPGQEVNGWNLSAVLRTNPTLGLSDADFRARATNLEVYQTIESDLLTAIELLPTAALATPNVYRISRGAAQALLARVYLYWGRFDQAETLATAAMTSAGITDAGAGLMDEEDYVAGFSVFPNPESVFELEIRAVDWSGVDGVNNSISSLTTNVLSSAQFILTVSDELLDSYEEGDVRRDIWTETTRTGSSEVVYRCNKWLGAKGDFLENLPIIRASELFLIRAEARYRNGNLAGSRADINALRAKRGLENVDGGLAGNALFNQILQERRVEFVLEGHRFFDLKRNGLDITKHGNFEDVPYSDYRILAPLPQPELQLNELLENNPGYN
ncbi:RagB/SusD family nutrient uptake outer membrane protein [Pararhodonellum marinum]|uniref:RagB/SusD family nutrient uptake outer membrane protein n=1 Tax=Pararhodonellum marinum TaxID=2755358 RepID=UPI00188E53BE|nr:RagB/SusD family nutrient uptake outer membrane protein [Pararhodonellum marinum]